MPTARDKWQTENELAIREAFFLHGIKAKEAISRLQELGHDYKEAITIMERWMTDEIKTKHH